MRAFIISNYYYYWCNSTRTPTHFTQTSTTDYLSTKGNTLSYMKWFLEEEKSVFYTCFAKPWIVSERQCSVILGTTLNDKLKDVNKFHTDLFQLWKMVFKFEAKVKTLCVQLKYACVTLTLPTNYKTTQLMLAISILQSNIKNKIPQIMCYSCITQT